MRLLELINTALLDVMA